MLTGYEVLTSTNESCPQQVVKPAETLAIYLVFLSSVAGCFLLVTFPEWKFLLTTVTYGSLVFAVGLKWYITSQRISTAYFRIRTFRVPSTTLLAFALAALRILTGAYGLRSVYFWNYQIQLAAVLVAAGVSDIQITQLALHPEFLYFKGRFCFRNRISDITISSDKLNKSITYKLRTLFGTSQQTIDLTEYNPEEAQKITDWFREMMSHEDSVIHTTQAP